MSDNLLKKTYRPSFIDKTYRPDAKVGRFLTVLILYGVSFGFYRGVQDNYLAEIIHITPFERGIVEFFRETPGLLLILILALMYRFADSKVFKIGIAVMAGGCVGVLLSSVSPFFMTKIFVVVFMVLFSTGEHIIMPVRATIAMDIAKKEKAGASLGLSNSISQFGNIAGFIFVTVIFIILEQIGFNRRDIFGYRIVFGASAALMTAAALVAAALRETTLKAQRRRFYFAKKFHKFYMLEIFYGARKQIFLTFAPYVLILQYGADPSIMSILYAICAGFGMLCSPLIGRIIDKVGYKAVMVADTLILIIVCLLYGFAHRLFPPNVMPNIAFLVVCCNFILDSIISIASMASNIYVQRIASNQEEITATLSTGISVNHIISIFIALMGGWIWKVTGIEVLFSLSAFLGLINSIYAATIKKEEEFSTN
ncbi:hypothetical protein R84B8_02979 [Treponema sp. R8-4-B8]